jgi:hypothetical protein
VRHRGAATTRHPDVLGVHAGVEVVAVAVFLEKGVEGRQGVAHRRMVTQRLEHRPALRSVGYPTSRRCADVGGQARPGPGPVPMGTASPGRRLVRSRCLHPASRGAVKGSAMEDHARDEPQPNPACATCAEPILPGVGRYRRGSTSSHATCEWATLPSECGRRRRKSRESNLTGARPRSNVP